MRHEDGLNKRRDGMCIEIGRDIADPKTSILARRDLKRHLPVDLPLFAIGPVRRIKRFLAHRRIEAPS